jgi:hypothetical protein
MIETMSAITRFEQPDVVRSGKRLPGKIVRSLDDVRKTGLHSSARVQAHAYVAHVAMRHIAMLSEEEGRLIHMTPLAEQRLKVIVDQFSANAAFELQRMAWQGQ